MGLKVLIGGGTGFIGRALTTFLRDRGHTVVIVSRNPGPSDTILWENIKKNGLPDGTDAVVSLSGKPIIDPISRFTSGYKQELYDSRILSNETLTNAILSAEVKPKAWVSISGVGYYDPSLVATYDENSPGGQTGFLCELAQKWEEASKLPPDFTDTRHVIVRAGAVLGKNGGALKSMLWPFWLGLGGPIGSGKQWFPWIHIDDIVGILTHAIENDHIAGVLNGVAPTSHTNEEFTRLLAKSMNRPAIFRVPGFAMNVMLGGDSASVLLEGQRVVPRLTLESGYSFKYPELEEALQSIVN